MPNPASLADTNFTLDDKAAQVCPVGVILKKRRGFAVPIGERTYDKRRSAKCRTAATEGAEMNAPVKKKLKVATTSLAGCFGCHMSLLDIDERLFTLLEHIEFDRSPLTDIKTSARTATSASSKAACAMPRTSMCCASSARTARS
jgi:hypothetical protein